MHHFRLLIHFNTDVDILTLNYKVKTTLIIQKNPNYDEMRMNAFCCDITNSDLSSLLLRGPVDVISLIFVLSAIHPDKMKDALRNIHYVRQIGRFYSTLAIQQFLLSYF